MSAQRPWHPLYLRYKTKVESEGKRCPTRRCCSQRAAIRVTTRLSPCSEADHNAAATQHGSTADTSPKDVQVWGKRQQRHFPNNAGANPAVAGGSAACLYVRCEGGKMNRFAFFQGACGLPCDEQHGAGKPPLTVALASLNITRNAGKYPCPSLAEPKLLIQSACSSHSPYVFKM